MHVSSCRRALLAPVALAFILAPATARGDISGFVRVKGSGTPGTPIAGARVHIVADSSVVAVSGVDGSFTLAVSPIGLVELAASVPYSRAAAVSYLIDNTFANDGDTAVDIRLEILPTADDPSYTPPSAGYCGGCHASVFPLWESSNHANTASNPWVLDLFAGSGTPGGGAGYVFRDTHDAGETGFCATCHAPMADVFDPGHTMLDEVAGTALEGVNCVSCHQMDSVDEGNLDALHFLGKSTYRFPDGTGATANYVWGPLDDVTFNGMKVSHSTLHKTSLVCAACHQYTNPDTGAPGQNTYREWAASQFAVPGPGQRTCQSCHMPEPEATDGTPLCVIVAPDRPTDQRRRHVFTGSTPDMLQNNVALTLAAEEAAGRVRVFAGVNNFGAGHSFPTGVSIRNAILVVRAELNGQPLTQIAGPTVPFWGSDDVPGDQPGDLAGLPGKGFAKILEGRINGEGPTVRPVLFIDAEGVTSDTLIPSGATDMSTYEFDLPPGVAPGTHVNIQAQLVYRRTFRALQVTKGWTESAHGGPIEIEVANQEVDLPVTGIGGSVVEIPTASAAGLCVLALVLALLGALHLRRKGAGPAR